MVLTSQRKSVKLSSLKPPGRDSLMPLAIWTGPMPFQLYIKSSVVQPSISHKKSLKDTQQNYTKTSKFKQLFWISLKVLKGLTASNI